MAAGRTNHLLVVAAIACTAIQVQAQSAEQAWAITGATLIDGTGRQPMAMSVIRGHGDRIVCAGRPADCPISPSDVRLDASGRWVMPGLIDTHVHLNWQSPDASRRAQHVRFALGITTTREAGTVGNLDANLAHRRAANAADTPEPRLLVSGLASDENAKRLGARDAGDLADRLAGLGVDAIKIKRDFDGPEWQALVREAHRHGIPVWGHTWTEFISRFDEAMTAGIDGVTHMLTFSEYAQSPAVRAATPPQGVEFWVWIKEKWLALDDAALGAIADRMIAQETWFEPLLLSERHFTTPYVMPEAFAFLGPVPSWRQTIRPWLSSGDDSRGAIASRRARIDRVYARMCDFVRLFHDRGGRLITGTDDEPPGASLLDEIELLAQCGLSPMQAIQAATSSAAVALRRPEIGTVAPGQLADLVILDADPLERLTNLRRVWRVMKGGYVHDPAPILRPLVDAHRAEVRRSWTITGAAVTAVALGAAGTLWAVLAVTSSRRRR